MIVGEWFSNLVVDDANHKPRLFRNYLIEHRIFMTDVLRKKFGAACDSLATALSDYSAGRDAGKSELERSGQEEVNRLRTMIDEVEQAVQRRLHFEEA